MTWVWGPEQEALAVMHARKRSRTLYAQLNLTDAVAYYSEQQQLHDEYVRACQDAGVCRYPFCWQPTSWAGADLDADPNAGGWCEHHA